MLIKRVNKFFFAQAQKMYDWRDDPKYNLDIEKDNRHYGWDPKTYTEPYSAAHDDWLFNVPTIDKLNLDVAPENRRIKFITEMQAPIVNLNKDIAHEMDFESEDVDFQPENPNMQHFKKTMPHSIWNFILIALLPFIYYCIIIRG